MFAKNEKLVQSDWDDLGGLDPMWAVLSDPKKRYGQWKEGDFYQTGKEFISEVLTEGKALGAPHQKLRALDFGCGVGRLSFALADFFSDVIGVDVSATMLQKARAYGLQKNKTNCQFVHNNQEDLSQFETNSFDFVGTYIVLQHIPDKAIIEKYIIEFVRILKPGGLLFFQIPTYVPLRNRWQLRRRAYSFFRKFGVPINFLYSTLGLHPIYYNFVSADRIAQILTNCKILKVDTQPCLPSAVISSTYFVTK